MSKTFKMIQINIWKGQRYNDLLPFLQKENPDIITMQEVTRNKDNFFTEKGSDLFTLLTKNLPLNGFFVNAMRISDNPEILFGNAVFTKGKIINSQTVWLKEYDNKVYNKVEDFPHSPKNILDIKSDFDGTKIHILSTHLAWTTAPSDTPEKIRQANVFANYLKSLKDEPFVIGGDFNVEQNTKVIKMIDTVAENAIKKSSIKNSLHPTIHYAGKLHPNGLLVDYIYTSKHFKVEKIEAPVVDISDHLPIIAKLQL